MLTRNSQVGEFYIMGPPETPPIKADGSIGSWVNTLDMMIFDEEGDRHHRIKWEDAMKATLSDNADIKTGTLDKGKASAMTIENWRKAAEAWSELNKGNATYAATADKVTNTNTNEEFKKVYIVVARPFIEHQMHSAILAVNGADTGVTLFGPSDMQISVSCFPLTTAHLSIPTCLVAVSLCLSRQTPR